jgi:hypothetical protein
MGAPQRGQGGAFSRFDNFSEEEDATAPFQCWDRGRSYRLLTVDLADFQTLGPVLPLALPNSIIRILHALWQLIIIHNVLSVFEVSTEYKKSTPMTCFKSSSKLGEHDQSPLGTQAGGVALIE